ncbi:MAG: hypothetical protein D6766_02695 [Verrucomicrobia bacterium]|nr:MAG: hypothetical protein D6766_02695 [Verrucomicrobiota bacterium]
MVAACCSFAGRAAPDAAAPEPSLAHTPLVATRLPAGPGHPWADGWENAALVRIDPDGTVTPLLPDFAASCDPDVSHDGRKLVFAGKRHAGDRWRIWEMDLEEGRPRPITSPERDCRHPLYLSRLFTLDSPEPWATLLFVGAEPIPAARGGGVVRNLFNVKLDGTDRFQVTANPADDLDPFQALDGRILYSSWRWAETGPVDARLFAVSLDGTNVELYGGERGKRFQRMPCVTPGGRVVFVESDTITPDGAGQLACLREARPHHSYRVLTADPAWLWLTPCPWSADEILVSRRPAEGGPAELVLFNLSGGRSTPVRRLDGFHLVQARPIRERPRPDGCSTVADPARETGILYGLNLYDADVRLAPHLAKGSIRRLRVVQGLPSRGARPTPWRRLLGEAPVEADGSFHLEVPAETPLQLQALDTNGLAVATCEWIWVRPRESRGCIGCHEDPERVPENIFVQAVRKPAVPVHPPADQRPVPGFREKVWPILQQSCSGARCHGGPDAEWRLGEGEAGALATYRLLRERYVQPGRARASRLTWHLLGRNTARPWDAESAEAGPFKPMPPAKAEPLPAESLQTLIEWMDLGAPWSEDSPIPPQQP